MQTQLRRYKRAEAAAYKKVSSFIVRCAQGVASACAAFVQGGSQSVSILIVSHNEEPPRGLRVSMFGLAGIAMLAAAVVVMAVAFAGGLGEARAKASASNADLVQAQDELDGLRTQTGRLTAAYQDFQTVLEPILAKDASVIGTQVSKTPAALFPRRQAEAQTLAEISTELDQSAPVIAEYGSMLGKMDSIKATVPAIWPIAGGIGHISTTFGINPNPFTGQSYFHTGIDCSTYRAGDTLVATSDGKVIFAGIEGGYGRCVVIAHAYGYMTRYGHMDRILVHSGQSVKQGQGIGILGNSGVSTAPHTHYEVIMGKRYLDPTDYLWSGANSFPIITGGGFGD